MSLMSSSAGLLMLVVLVWMWCTASRLVQLFSDLVDDFGDVRLGVRREFARVCLLFLVQFALFGMLIVLFVL